MAKWRLHTVYSKDREIRAYLPQTALFNRSTLTSYINRFRSVFVKPNLEHAGKGIMKAWKTEKGYSFVKVRGARAVYPTIETLYQKLHKETLGKKHVIQRAIPLAKIKGRPYDIRVMMMRDASDRWKYIGILAKVAGPSSVVTNVRRGHGYAATMEYALSESLRMSKDQQRRMIEKLKRLSYKICNRSHRYRYSSQIGIDFAIDQNGKIWVIEVNFDYPSHALFNKLSDKTMYRKIKATRSAYLKSRKKYK